MTRLGRKPQGIELVEGLSGSKHAKERMRWFWETIQGACLVREACAALGICESRFHEQRSAWMQESLALLEPRAAGRPAKPAPPIAPDEVQGLREQIRALEARAAAAEVQAELARTLPHVMRRASAGKKTTKRRKPRTPRVSSRAVRRP
jgi:hypothetical protein